MSRLSVIAGYLLSASASCAYESPLYAWKFEKLYGMCLISLPSIGNDYRLAISSIGTSHTDTELFWMPDIIHNWDASRRYDILLVFDNSLKSLSTGFILKNTDMDRMSISEKYNLEAFGQHDLLELYVDGKYVAAFALPGASAAIQAWTSCTLDAE